MVTLTVSVGNCTYPIHIGSDFLRNEHVFKPFISAHSVAIITDDNVAPLYLKTLKTTLSNYALTEIILPNGEQSKNLTTLSRIFDLLVANYHDRQTTLIALGGGVVGDITGFAAACYQRGINFIQVPTTLLAQVDASVGGKTGVNHPQGKNMIGAFYQPRCVVIDTSLLKTLPKREFVSGLAEVVKYGLILDSQFYHWVLENSLSLARQERESLTYAITRSCEIKAQIVSEDEKEINNKRITLNLGHTFAHAIETFTRYQYWLHGEAVAVGLLIALSVSQKVFNSVSEETITAFRQFLIDLNLPTKPPKEMKPSDFLDLMKYDKKVQKEDIRLILLKEIGNTSTVRVSDLQGLEEILAEFCIN